MGYRERVKSLMNEKQEIINMYNVDISAENTFSFSGYIYEPYDFNYRLSEVEEDHVNILINSEGGSFFDSINIHNKLRKTGKKICAYVDPFAFSAAFVVALAADEIYMVENGLMMTHVPMRVSEEPETAEELMSAAEVLKKAEEILCKTLAAKTGRSDDECRAMFSKETWFTAEEAKEAGIVNEIIPITRSVKIENRYPERIVNFLKGKVDMPLKDVCDRFGIENSEEALVKYINGLQPTKPIEVHGTIVNAMKKVRESELESLVSGGFVTPVVVNELRVKFVTDDRIKKDIVNESDEFDTIIGALRKNDKVVNFGSKTGTQKPPKEDAEDDILVKNMQKRLSKA